MRKKKTKLRCKDVYRGGRRNKRISSLSREREKREREMRFARNEVSRTKNRKFAVLRGNSIFSLGRLIGLHVLTRVYIHTYRHIYTQTYTCVTYASVIYTHSKRKSHHIHHRNIYRERKAVAQTRERERANDDRMIKRESETLNLL